MAPKDGLTLQSISGCKVNSFVIVTNGLVECYLVDLINHIICEVSNWPMDPIAFLYVRHFSYFKRRLHT